MPATLLTDRLDHFQSTDLRRNIPAEVARTIADRAEWCMPEDRALLEAMYRQGLSATQIAELRGVSDRVIRRRIRTIVERVLSPDFTYVIRNRERWTPTRRRVATACILQGRSFRQTASHLRLSLHTVRRQMDAIRAMLETDQSRTA